MNCATARERLLGSERPESPGPALGAHLASCPACRSTQRRLARLERAIPRLHVPPCPPPPRLFDEVLHGPALVRTPERLRHQPDTTRETARQKLALALALAASLAVFALAWWAWPHRQVPTVSPARMQYEKRLHAKLQPGLTQRQSVERLTDLAEEMFAEAKSKANDPAQMDQLAYNFDCLMRQDLPHQAGQLSGSERQAALRSVTARLATLESEAARLASAHDTTRAARTLRQIAAAVRDADRRLRQIAEARG